MNDIKILQLFFEQPLQEKYISDLIREFPNDLKEYILSFKRPIDQTLSLAGYKLLAHMLKPYNVPLDSLKRDISGRPFIKEFIGDFNISHSNKSVICAVSKTGRVGIDLEYIRKLELEPFRDHFSKEQWLSIMHSETPLRSFYDFWCKKEAIVKLDGRGLTIPLKDIPTHSSPFVLHNEQSVCKNLDVGDLYSAAVACSFEDQFSEVAVLRLDQLL